MKKYINKIAILLVMVMIVSSCRMERQRQRASHYHSAGQSSSAWSVVEHSRAVKDSSGYRFYFYSDSPFFFHPTYGLSAGSGKLMLDQNQVLVNHLQTSQVAGENEDIHALDASSSEESGATSGVASVKIGWKTWLWLLLVMFGVWCMFYLLRHKRIR